MKIMREINFNKIAQPESSSRFMESILRFLKSISVTFGASQIMELLRAELEKTLGFRRVWLYRLSDDGLFYEIIVDAAPGLKRPAAAQRLRIEGDKYLEQLLLADDLLVIEDAQGDPRVNLDIVSILKNRTLLNYPFQIHGRRYLIGTGTFGHEGLIKPGPAELGYFRTMAEAARLSMERSMLAESGFGSRESSLGRLSEDLLATSLPRLTFWERDLRTGKLSLTPGCNTSIGYPDESDIDSFEKYLALVHPEDAPGLKAAIEAYLAQPGERFHGTYRLKHKNGAFRWFYDEGGLIYDELKEPVKLAVIRCDITDQKNAELAILASESRLQMLLEDGEVSLWDFDLKTTELTFNAGGPNHLGYGVSEISRHANDWLALFHPDDMDEIRQQFHRFISGNSDPFDSVLRMRHKNGSYRYIRVRVILQHDSLGQPLRALGCSVDVTALKLAEMRLNAQAEYLKILVRESPVPMVLLDTELNYLAVSEPYKTNYHKGLQNVIGQNHLNVMTDLPEHWIQANKRALAGEYVHHEAEEWKRADGSSFWVLWSIGPWFDSDGKIGGIYIVADDVTRRHELQRQVVEIAGQFQQQFSEDLHDTVCQELTALSMYSESLAESFGAEDERSRAILKRIDEGLNRSIYDVRQLMQGQMPVHVTGPGFVQAIEELSTLDNTFSEYHVKVVVDSMPVNLDDLTANQLYLIVRESVHNAIKHARPEEVLVIVSARPHLCVTVQNQLAEGQQSSVFKQKTGLGRKIMQHRAAMIGGLIRFESIENDRVQLTCELERIAYEN